MDYKVGDTVKCVGIHGKHQIVASKASPTSDVTKGPFYKTRTLPEGYDFIIGQLDENGKSTFAYVMLSQLRGEF